MGSGSTGSSATAFPVPFAARARWRSRAITRSTLRQATEMWIAKGGARPLCGEWWRRSGFETDAKTATAATVIGVATETTGVVAAGA